MASPHGRLSLLAIATIFLVVFGGMYAGVEYARGDLVDHETPTAAETQLRADVWDAVNERRADRGLDPAQRDASVRTEAQDTATYLTTADYFAGPTAVGVRTEGNRTLPNVKGFCYRTPAKLTVADPRWNDDGSGRGLPAAVSREVADRAVDLLASDPSDVLSRSNDRKHGIGVAIDGDVVYVVYRTCSLGY